VIEGPRERVVELEERTDSAERPRAGGVESRARAADAPVTAAAAQALDCMYAMAGAVASRQAASVASVNSASNSRAVPMSASRNGW
jgi:hypothetical protein